MGSLFSIDGSFDPYGPKPDGDIAPLEICLDAFGNGNGIAEVADTYIVANDARLGDSIGQKFSWKNFESALISRQLLPQGYNDIDALLLADRIKAEKVGVQVNVGYESSHGFSNFYTEFIPPHFTPETPTIFLMPGLGTAPQFYSEFGLAIAKSGVRAVIIDDPGGKFSQENGSAPKNVWGYSGENDYLDLRSGVLNDFIIRKTQNAPFAVANFSDGLVSILAWEKKYASQYGPRYHGAVDLAGTWGLSRKPGYAGPLSVNFLGNLNRFIPADLSFRDIRTPRIFQSAGSNLQSALKLRTLWYATTAEKFDGKAYGQIAAWTHSRGPISDRLAGSFNQHGHTFFLDPFDDVFIDPVASLMHMVEMNPSSDIHVVFFGSHGNAEDEADVSKQKMIVKLNAQFKIMGQWRHQSGYDVIELPNGKSIEIKWNDSRPVGHMIHLVPEAMDVVVDRVIKLF